MKSVLILFISANDSKYLRRTLKSINRMKYLNLINNDINCHDLDMTNIQIYTYYLPQLLNKE